MIPDGCSLEVTQGFKPLTNPSHDAIDVVVRQYGQTQLTNCVISYGSPFICPVKEAKVVLVNDFGYMNELGNGIDIEWQEDGYYWRLHFWHTVYNEKNLNDIVKEGDIIALMGNTGACVPMPTPEQPYMGTHLHLRMSRYKKDAWGGNTEITSIDPRLYFDINNPYRGNPTISTTIDYQPIKWAWEKLGIKTIIDKLTYLIRYFK